MVCLKFESIFVKQYEKDIMVVTNVLQLLTVSTIGKECQFDILIEIN